MSRYLFEPPPTVSVEVADIRHVLLAPVSHRAFMLRPIGQRLRAAAFAIGLAGAVLGQLIATEVEGSRAAWAAACGLFGVIVGTGTVPEGSNAVREADQANNCGLLGAGGTALDEALRLPGL